MKSRTAFTLVELLVTLAIITLVMAMSLPAIQRVREATSAMSFPSICKQFAIQPL